jgi:Cu(I)/Ag(I) efflux system membrane fusion protein
MIKTDHPKAWKMAVHYAVIFVVAVVLGLWLRGLFTEHGGPEERPNAKMSEHDALDHDAEAAAPEVWTCSMHPQIRQPKFGKCPLCFMDLILVKEDAGASLGPREIRLSALARELAQIETVRAERDWVEARVSMTGMIRLDETRLGHITAWFPGRIERMFVNYTGVAVRKGDHMAALYSPEVIATQNELILARKARTGGSTSGMAGLLQSTRARLRLWGLSDEQVAEMEKSDEPWREITIHAPMGGIVLERHVVEGEYIQTGTRLFTIGDLSRVWLVLEAFESDAPWLRFGQKVVFQTQAYPGEDFEGVVSFIQPTLNEPTRTVQVRVVVDNAQGRLLPGMFARATVRARLAQGGKVVAPDLEGKWISPMHPEIVKDAPGSCDVCGMPLVKAETLGYASTERDAEPPLSIPATAPLITGTRAVVYVENQTDTSVFEGREIRLGPRAGDRYIVESGLEEGEKVVVRGNFKIDSAMQILAKPSMMSADGSEPAGPDAATPKAPAAPFEGIAPAFHTQAQAFFAEYLKIQKALAADDLPTAVAAIPGAEAALGKIDMALLSGAAHDFWMGEARAMDQALKGMAKEKDNMGPAREWFKSLSDAAIRTARRLGVGKDFSLTVFYCPMAFNNQGAEWLQGDDDLLNPYFGAMMLKCGEARDRLGGK